MSKVTRPLPSATVLLARQRDGQIELYCVVRGQGVSFAKGALAFPGGATEEGDAEIAAGIGGSGEIDVHRVAAVREVFEETGFILARCEGSDPAPALIGELQIYRARVATGELAFGKLLAEFGLTPDIGRLCHIGHWITPEHMPKRFSTHFFLTAVPAGQSGIHDGVELVESFWLPAGEIASCSEYKVMPPTAINSDRVARYRELGEAISELGSQPVLPVTPRVEKTPEGQLFTIPLADGTTVTRLLKKT